MITFSPHDLIHKQPKRDEKGWLLSDTTTVQYLHRQSRASPVWHPDTLQHAGTPST